MNKLSIKADIGCEILEVFIVIYKAIITVYFIITCLQNPQYKFSQVEIIVAVLLIYIIINVLKEIIEPESVKNVLIGLSMVIIAIGYYYGIKLFIIFWSLSFIELLYVKISKVIIGVIFVLQGIFIFHSSYINQFILFSCLSFFFYDLLQKSFNRISNILIDNEKLRSKNEMLMINLESSEKLEQQMVYTSKLEERNKVAQEIHDKIGHTISGSTMQLEAAKMLLEVDQEKAKTLIQITIDVLRDGMENIRSTLRSIKPAIEQMGINNLDLSLSKFSKSSGIKSNLFCEGNLDVISFKQWKVIYDNVNESLTNAIKYSAAKSLSVKIQILNKFIKVEVKDDGKGCDVYSKGLGLMGMDERTAGVNGKLIVDGSDGFSVITLLPIVRE